LTKKSYWDNIIIMVEHRKTVRLKTLDRVILDGFKDKEILLKDISVTGCRVVCSNYADIKLNTRYKLEVIPDSSSKIGFFELLVETRWIKTSVNSFEIGFFILESPKGEQFRFYVDFLSLRYSRGGTVV